MAAASRTRFCPCPEDDITGLTTQGTPSAATAARYSLAGVHEAVRRGRQLRGFGGEAADAFAIHGQPGRARSGSRVRRLPPPARPASACGSPRSRHHQVRPFARHRVADRRAIEHVQHMAAMRDLHRRGHRRNGLRRSPRRRTAATRSPLPCRVRRRRAGARAARAGQGRRSRQKRAWAQGRCVGKRRFYRPALQAFADCPRDAAACHPPRMPIRPAPMRCTLAATVLAVAWPVAAPTLPFARLSGLVTSKQLDEISGLAASRTPARCGRSTTAAIRRGCTRSAAGGRLLALRRARGEEHRLGGPGQLRPRGPPFLLVADTGDNGGLPRHRTARVREPPRFADGTLRPAWTIRARWPDGPRATSRRSRSMPARARSCWCPRAQAAGVVRCCRWRIPVARCRNRGGSAAWPRPRGGSWPAAQRAQAGPAVPAGDRRRPVAGWPDLAVLTYGSVLFYRREPGQDWREAVAANPEAHDAADPRPRHPDHRRWGPGPPASSTRPLYADHGEFHPSTDCRD